jgi:hypothetical protein
MNRPLHRRSSLALWTATVLLAMLAAIWAPTARAEGGGLWRAAPSQTTGSGNVASQTRQVAGFSAILASGPLKIEVRQSAHEALVLRADDNLLPLIETVVENGTLRIAPKRGESLRTRVPIVVTVDVVDLKALTLSGSGDVSVDALKTPALDMRLSGSSDAKLRNIAIDDLGVRVSGSGDVQAAGTTKSLTVSIDGSGDLHAQDLQADEVSIRIAGSGDASVTANKTLSVSIAGSGGVDYGGKGVVVKSSISGSGSVKQRR